MSPQASNISSFNTPGSSPNNTSTRTPSKTFSSAHSANRNSHASIETAESSTAASQRSSLLHDGSQDSSLPVMKDGRSSHRSHRSRTSGGFLLSTTTFDPLIRDTTPPKNAPAQGMSEHKGKGALKSPEKKHRKRISDVGTALRGSPLAGNVTTIAAQSQDANGSEALGENSLGDENGTTAQQANGTLDVDATQIVNLALSLSESRKNVSRRLVSNPLPSPAAGSVDGMVGGSMRYHMQQQQRRSSRNVSPKPDRGERHLSVSSRVASGQRLQSPLQPAFDEEPLKYQFSASTLARAEKAKKAMELMAQYREILQYVPPLKPPTLERITTASTMGSSHGSPGGPYAYRQSNAGHTTKALGREYNPLQYIRNRKVRARTAKGIDGEVQGFGDLEKVTPWVRKVCQELTSSENHVADCSPLPPFHDTESTGNAPTSPQSTMGKSSNAARTRRPRNDWIINPADMLADVFWLEQDDNKKLIEDRFGRRIFPRDMQLRPPVPKQELSKEATPPQGQLTPGAEEEPQKDTKLPEFKSIKQDNENFAEKSAARARQKLRHVRDAAKQHTQHGSGRDVRNLLRSRNNSDDSSSDSDSDHRQRRKRSGTADTDRGKVLLEKQLSQMLEEEANVANGGADTGRGRRDAVVLGSKQTSIRNGNRGSLKGSPSHSRSASLINHSKRNSLMYPSSGRASVEAPRPTLRASLDLELDSTAPNSPELGTSRAKNVHVPSISMNLSPPQSRHSSPSRSALSKIKAKIRPHHDRNTHSDHSLIDDAVVSDNTAGIERLEDTSAEHRRSISPIKRLPTKKSVDLSSVVKVGGGHKDKVEDPSGIRGFLKSARHPVNRVSDILWKKDPSPSRGASSDDSDDSDAARRSSDAHSEDISGNARFDDLARAFPPKEKPSYLADMPTFTSTSEVRGRPPYVREAQYASGPLLAVKEDRTRRAASPQPFPTTTIRPTLTTPEFIIPNWKRRGSTVSEFRRGSFPDGVEQADSRLNAILGIPGKHRTDNLLPVTGLANIDTTNRRPSMQAKRQWSISDQAISITRGPTTLQEIARVRALLLSSGIKAKEISARSVALTDLRTEKAIFAELVQTSNHKIGLVPNHQKHIVASQILANDIETSARIWQESADSLCSTTMPLLYSSISTLQSRLSETLTPLTRQASDEADEVSKDLVTSQTLNVKRINDKIERMIRVRRRRLRWLRRGGWVLVEWALVGVMWYVWFLVVISRIVLGIGRGVVGGVRWLLFL